MKKLAFEIILIIGLFLLINASHTYYHEFVHKEICESYGGTSSVYYSPLFQGAMTECSVYEGKEYHLMNEIFGYNIRIMITTIFAVLLIYVIHSHKKNRSRLHF